MVSVSGSRFVVAEIFIKESVVRILFLNSLSLGVSLLWQENNVMDNAKKRVVLMVWLLTLFRTSYLKFSSSSISLYPYLLKSVINDFVNFLLKSVFR